MAEGAFWARRNKPIWPASADPVGQPVPGPNQPPKFLNRFSILPLDFQDNPLKYLAESIAIGRQWMYLICPERLMQQSEGLINKIAKSIKVQPEMNYRI